MPPAHEHVWDTTCACMSYHYTHTHTHTHEVKHNKVQRKQYLLLVLAHTHTHTHILMHTQRTHPAPPLPPLLGEVWETKKEPPPPRFVQQKKSFRSFLDGRDGVLGPTNC